MKKLSGPEVAEHLRKAIRGEIAIKLIDPKRSWSEIYAGDVEFDMGGWYVTVFNDCNELDYCDHVKTPDGREGEFDDWFDAREEPIDLLSAEEQEALKRALESAT